MEVLNDVDADRPAGGVGVSGVGLGVVGVKVGVSVGVGVTTTAGVTTISQDTAPVGGTIHVIPSIRGAIEIW